MTLLARIPLRRKLTWLAMTCSIVALLVTSVALGAYEWVYYRKATVSHLLTLAEVTARTSTAAVAFANTDDAARVLAALDTEADVLAAVLYDARGRRLAGFSRPSGAAIQTPAVAPREGVEADGSMLYITVPVAESKRFGTLLVIADVSSIRTRLLAYGIVLLCTTLVSGIIAYLITGWLQERIVAPVRALAAAATAVQANADYTVRVPKEADDEMGSLTDAFNSMLGRIHQNELEIARAGERLRLAVESAKIGTWDWDMVNDVVLWNQRNYEIFGIEPGALITSSIYFDRVHPEDRSRVISVIENAMGAATEFTVEFRIHSNTAEPLRYISVRGRFLPAPVGVPKRAVGVTVDITERRKAELRVIESELRFRAVAERAPAMIWSCDPALNRDYFNKTWLSFTGRTLDVELGRGWRDGMPEPDQRRWDEAVARAVLEHDPYSVEYRLRRADGTLRWIFETGAPRLTADGSFAGYLGSCIDITARKDNESELEAHVRLRTRELELANQELESFSYSVSHDLRGPVRAIQGFGEIALEEIDAGSLPSARERIGRILRAADRMNKLIDAFLGMARVSRAELKVNDVNLSRIAEEIVGFLRVTDPTRDVEVVITPDLTVRGDERLLRIAMENLFNNAWKFTSRREHAKIEFGCRRSDGEIVYLVRDNGAGFDPTLRHKLFHAFERLHSGSQFEGLGVGLTSVQRVVEKHNGRIWAESEPDKGATFFFTLPGPVDRQLVLPAMHA